MRTFSNKTFTLSMRYINEEVHEPPRVNEEKSQSLSDGKAKGARALLVTIKRGSVPAKECEEKRGREDRYDPETPPIKRLPIIITTLLCIVITLQFVRPFGYASTVITGITPDSYSCTCNFLCTPLMSMLILY